MIIFWKRFRVERMSDLMYFTLCLYIIKILLGRRYFINVLNLSQLTTVKTGTKINPEKAREVLDTNKAILRKIGSTMVPNNIAYRKKLGFPTPLDNWFKTGMIEYAKEILLDSVSINRNLFNNNKLCLFLSHQFYSTVTLFARLRGRSTSQPRRTAIW